jgi:hypothetical protein
LFSDASFGAGFFITPRQTALILNVRRVLSGSFLCTARYSRIHNFDVYFALRIGEETYCGDYETVVLDEIKDLVSSEGKDVAVGNTGTMSSEKPNVASSYGHLITLIQQHLDKVDRQNRTKITHDDHPPLMM